MPRPVHIRIPESLLARIRDDLIRPHKFAAERVGFLTTRKQSFAGCDALYVTGYYPVPDDQYVDDPSVGARISEQSIDQAYRWAASGDVGVFHIHAHSGKGAPGLSRTDERELPHLVQPMTAIGKEQAHGIFLLSDDACKAWAWRAGERQPVVVEQITVVGRTLRFFSSVAWKADADDEQYARQSFLGSHAQAVFRNARVGVVGLGGGGSHIVQQLAHLGVRHVYAFDGDRTEATNLNRNVGSTLFDARSQARKFDVAWRVHHALVPDSAFGGHPGRWQESADLLASCDLVFGCLDTFEARRELEAECRRHLIPYIDIGMDVHQVGDDPPRMAGQVILSVPGGPCMKCIDFLNEETLAQEAARYGDTGGRPQVVWANGILSSAAIGIGVDVLTGWTCSAKPIVYLSLDANKNTMKEHPDLRFFENKGCDHYPLDQTGPPQLHSI